MIIHVKLSEREEYYVNRMKELGYPVPETIRQAIREFGNKEFPEEPLYAQVARERLLLSRKKLIDANKIKDMSPEEYAVTELKGKMVEVNGKPEVEFRTNHGESVFYNLFAIKEKTKDNDPIIANHIALINRTYVYADGFPPTEEKYKEIFKDW